MRGSTGGQCGSTFAAHCHRTMCGMYSIVSTLICVLIVPFSCQISMWFDGCVHYNIGHTYKVRDYSAAMFISILQDLSITRNQECIDKVCLF